MGEFVIFQSDAAAAEVEWLASLTDNLLADVVVVPNAFIGNYEGIGGEL